MPKSSKPLTTPSVPGINLKPTLSAEYLGNLKCRAVHTESGATLVTDAPKDNKGEGSAFSPTDLVATALGTCMLTIVGIAARQHGIDITGTRVDVVKEMSNLPPRKIIGLRSTITFPRKFSTDEQQLLERAAQACPVHKSLDPAIEAPVTFVYPD